MPKFRKKPVVIEAIQLIGSDQNINEILSFMDQTVDLSCRKAEDAYCDYCRLVREIGMRIRTLEGIMTASIGDWIIKGVNSEFYPCKPDIFEKTYEVIEE